MTIVKKDLLTKEQAYEAMYNFIEKHYKATGKSREFADLLDWMGIVSGPTKTADSSMWISWLKSIDETINEGEKAKRPETNKRT